MQNKCLGPAPWTHNIYYRLSETPARRLDPLKTSTALCPQQAAGRGHGLALSQQHATVKRRVLAQARRKGQRASQEHSSSQAEPANAKQLLQALIQLASRATIVIGSHQAYAVMDTLEPLLPEQLHTVPINTLASGLWAMTRLQLQPTEQTITAIAQHLLQSHQQVDSSTVNILQQCDTRTLGTFIFTLNYFMLREPAFWAAASSAAAAAGQQHLRALKPSGISNLLQGLAASGWTAQADAAVEHTASNTGQLLDLGSREVDTDSQQRQQQQRAVTSLLSAVEQLLLSEPERLGTWRMRDISQLCQSYALMGWDCTLLFAAVANHLLEYSSPPRRPPTAAATASRPGGTSSGSSSGSANPSWLQQQWNQQSRAAAAASRPQQQHQGFGIQQSWHYKGRGPGRLAECRAGDAAGLAWAFVATWCTNQLLLQELAAVVAANAMQLHAAECSRLLWAYATAGLVDKPMLAAVTAAVADDMSTVLPRTAASCLWSLAVMGFEAPGFMEAALDRLAACLDATPVGPAAPASAAAPADTLANVHSSHSAAAASSSGTGNASAAAATTAAGPGADAVGGTSALQQLLQEPPDVLLSCGPEVSQTPTTGDLSILSMIHRQHMAQQQQALPGQRNANSGIARQLNPQQAPQEYEQRLAEQHYDLADVLQEGWADSSSRLDVQEASRSDTAVLQGQHQQQQQQHLWQHTYASSDVVHCTVRDVAQAVYACGRLQHLNAGFCHVLRVKFKDLLPKFGDFDLVAVIWGLARLNLYDSNNMEAAAAELLSRVDRFPGVLLGLTAWSYSSLKHAQPQLFKAIGRRACQLTQARQLKPLDANQLVRAAAKLCFRDDQMFKACAVVLYNNLHRMGDFMLISSLWGFAVAGYFDGELFEQGFKKVSSLPVHKARPLLLLQLFQAATLLQDAYSTGGLAPPASLPPSLMLAATRQWMFSKRRGAGHRESTFHTAVVQVLEQELGLQVDEEVLTDDGLFSIDAVVTWGDRRVAIEIDGPDHFTNSTPHLLLGSSVAKQRCLQARGWAVLSIPFYAWNSITDSHDQQPLDSVLQERQQHRQEPQQSTVGTVEGRIRDQSGDGVVGVSDLPMSERAHFLAAELERAVTVAGLPLSLQTPRA